MSDYTPAQRCMLLLFADLEEEHLAPGTYRMAQNILAAFGHSQQDPDRDLDRQELLRLGFQPTQADWVLRRLTQTDLLDRHLDTLERLHIRAVTRICEQYPQRLRKVLGGYAPMVLYCAGNLDLFREQAVSLVGSRKLREPGRRFSETMGCQTAAEDLVYVSGGATGADTVGFEAAMESGGKAVIFLADSLQERMETMKPWLDTGRLLLVSEYGFDQHFSSGRAYSRNRLIHALGQKTFVAQSDFGDGGTWNGTLENLKNGWSDVLVCNEEPQDPGTRGLLDYGAWPILTEELHDLLSLSGGQLKLF
jgi:predicted Rossmann fold nucleotide-binding protein DprA/Smf involved in DNA uptake